LVAVVVVKVRVSNLNTRGSGEVSEREEKRKKKMRGARCVYKQIFKLRPRQDSIQTADVLGAPNVFANRP
jgi:hypothetical protein